MGFRKDIYRDEEQDFVDIEPGQQRPVKECEGDCRWYSVFEMSVTSLLACRRSVARFKRHVDR